MEERDTLHERNGNILRIGSLFISSYYRRMYM